MLECDRLDAQAAINRRLQDRRSLVAASKCAVRDWLIAQLPGIAAGSDTQQMVWAAERVALKAYCARGQQVISGSGAPWLMAQAALMAAWRDDACGIMAYIVLAVQVAQAHSGAPLSAADIQVEGGDYIEHNS